MVDTSASRQEFEEFVHQVLSDVNAELCEVEITWVEDPNADYKASIDVEAHPSVCITPVTKCHTSEEIIRDAMDKISQITTNPDVEATLVWETVVKTGVVYSVPNITVKPRKRSLFEIIFLWFNRDTVSVRM